MSSEVCPFCGKTYKRLKSHLPHCKAASSSKTPPTKHDVTATPTTTPSQLTAASSSVTTKAQAKRSEKVSVVLPFTPTSSPPATPLQSAHTSSSASPASLKPSTKKTKLKLSEQIKSANLSSSTAIPLASSASLPLTTSKPKKKSLRALIEAAAKSEQASNAALDGTTSAVKDLTPASTPKTTTQTQTKTNPHKDSVKDHVQPAVLSTDTKPKGASKIKTLKTNMANESLSTTKDTSSSQKLNVNENARPVNEILLRLRSGHQPRITLQDVKATLGRANTPRRSSRPSIQSQIQTSNDPSSKVRPGAGLSPASTSLTKISNQHLLPLAQQTLPAETSRADDGLITEKLQAEVRKQNTADNGSKSALSLRRLGQVRLSELPEWLSCKTPKHPRDVVEMVQRGWQWYYKKYFDVKKGGVGGLGMLLAGYCVISYIWGYPHIKRDRWRKYH